MTICVRFEQVRSGYKMEVEGEERLTYIGTIYSINREYRRLLGKYGDKIRIRDDGLIDPRDINFITTFERD